MKCGANLHERQKKEDAAIMRELFAQLIDPVIASLLNDSTHSTHQQPSPVLWSHARQGNKQAIIEKKNLPIN